MSAWVVEEEHINVLVWAGLHFTTYGPLRWLVPGSNPSEYRELDHSNATEVGALLWHENHLSVNYRYSEQTAEPPYTYRPPRFQTWSPVEVLKASHCLDYQSCEHPEWATSEARSFLDSLEGQLVSVLPGMGAAPWGIDTTTVPAASAAVRA